MPTQIDEKQDPQAVYTDGILNITLQLAKQGETKTSQLILQKVGSVYEPIRKL